MAELIHLSNEESDGIESVFSVLCSSCDVRFHLMWERKGDFAVLSFCPFCGEEFN